jgi:hypothetical protein
MNKVVIAGEAPASPFLFDHDDVLCASRFNAFGVERHDCKTDETDGADKNGFLFRLRRIKTSRRRVKVRFNPFNPFRPFYNHAAFSKKRRSLKTHEVRKSSEKQRISSLA